MDTTQLTERSVSLLEGVRDLNAALEDQQTWAETQLARLNLWAESLGVFAKGAFSVEHRLAENKQVRSVVNQLLTALSANIEHYRRAISQETVESPETQPESRDDDSSDGTSSTTISDLDAAQILLERGRKVEDGIGRLVQLAIRLRREGAKRSALKAASFDPKDEAGQSLVTPFALYIAAICQRALNARGQSTNVAMENATVTGTSPQAIHAHSSSLSPDVTAKAEAARFEAPHYLQERLKAIMLLRWRRVSYRRNHANDLAGPNHKPIAKNDGPKVTAKPALPASVMRESSRPLVAKAKVTLNVPAVRQPLSTASVVRPDFKIDTAKDLHAKTTPTVATKVVDDQLNFPRPPEVRSGVDTFMCPLCGLPRSTKSLEKRQWQSHVMQDLAPYFCVFQDCEQPLETFESSEEWLSHMKTEHARSCWMCQICRDIPTEGTAGIFDTDEEFRRHFEQTHDTSMTAGEMRQVSKMSCHKEMPHFDSCLFCGVIPPDYQDEIYGLDCQREIREHMSKTHMQYFALASLPWDVAGAEYADSGRVSGSSIVDKTGQELKRDIMDNPELKRFDTELERQDSMTFERSKHTAGFLELKKQFTLHFDDKGALVAWLAEIPKDPQDFFIVDRWKLLARRATDVSWAACDPEEVLRGDGDQEDDSDYASTHDLTVRQDRRRSVVPNLASISERDEQDEDNEDEEVEEMDAGPAMGHFRVEDGDTAQDTARSSKQDEETDTPPALNAVDEEKSFLELAAEGNVQQLSSFLDVRSETFNIQCHDGDDLNAIHLAVLAGSNECIKLLADAGCNINYESWEFGTPLTLAALRRGYGAVEMLLERAAQVHDYNLRLGSPLHAACIGGDRAIVERLLDNGGEFRSLSQTRRILLASVEAAQHFSPHERRSSNVKRIVRSVNADIEEPQLPPGKDQSNSRLKEIWGEPLLCAAYYGHGDVVKLLIERGARIDAKGDWDAVEDGNTRFDHVVGATALAFASLANKPDVVKLLLESGADAEHGDDKGTPPADHAAYTGSLEWLRHLVTNTPDEDERRAKVGEALHWAADYGRTACVRYLLDNGIAVDALDDLKQTALMFASVKGHSDLVALFLDKGAIVDHKSDAGNTALMLASLGGHVEVARMLLARNAFVNDQNQTQRSVLMFAAEAKDPGCLSLLLEHDANIELRDSQRSTALAYTAWSDRLENARLLVKRGAIVDAVDEDGWTPLAFAAEHDRSEIITLLLDSGADLEHRTHEGDTPLMLAARSGACNSIRTLLQRGADIAARDEEGNTALLEAANSNRSEALGLLLDKGASIEAEDDSGQTALSVSVNQGHVECLHILVEAGASPGASNRVWELALLLAAKEGNVACLRLLLSKTSPDSSDDDGTTALMFAASEGHKECVRLLLDAGAIANKEDAQGMRAIHHAARSAEFRCLKMLVKKGGQHSPRDREGQTPLMHVAKTRHFTGPEECVRLLLVAGASPDDIDNDGKTALWFAVQDSYSPIVKMLVKTGVDLERLDGDGFTLLMRATSSNMYKVEALLAGGARVDARHGTSGLNALAYSARNIHNCDTTVMLLKAGSSLSEVAQAVGGETLLEMRESFNHLMSCEVAADCRDLVQLQVDEIAQILDKLQRAGDPVVSLSPAQKERLREWAGDARSRNQALRKPKKVTFAPVQTQETEGSNASDSKTDDTSDPKSSLTPDVKSPLPEDDPESSPPSKPAGGLQMDPGRSTPRIVIDQAADPPSPEAQPQA